VHFCVFSTAKARVRVESLTLGGAWRGWQPSPWVRSDDARSIISFVSGRRLSRNAASTSPSSRESAPDPTPLNYQSRRFNPQSITHKDELRLKFVPCWETWRRCDVDRCPPEVCGYRKIPVHCYSAAPRFPSGHRPRVFIIIILMMMMKFIYIQLYSP